jgi:hypothetical protein
VSYVFFIRLGATLPGRLYALALIKPQSVSAIRSRSSRGEVFRDQPRRSPNAAEVFEESSVFAAREWAGPNSPDIRSGSNARALLPRRSRHSVSAKCRPAALRPSRLSGMFSAIIVSGHSFTLPAPLSRSAEIGTLRRSASSSRGAAARLSPRTYERGLRPNRQRCALETTLSVLSPTKGN